MTRPKPLGFSSLELIIVITLVVVALGALLQFLRTSQQHAHRQYEAANLRRLQVACTEYGATNKGWFPGLLGNGQYPITPFIGKAYYASTTIQDANTGAGATVHRANNYALAVLLEQDALRPAMLIAANESGLTTHLATSTLRPAIPNNYTPMAEPGRGEVTRLNVSYALLQYAVPELKSEWKNNANPQAPLCGSRLIFNAGAEAARPGRFSSLWTQPGSGKWKGSWVCNDGSTVQDSFDADSVASLNDTPFSRLKYGFVEFSPLGHDTASVGMFGKSGTGMRNFGAVADKGQLGSAND